MYISHLAPGAFRSQSWFLWQDKKPLPAPETCRSWDIEGETADILMVAAKTPEPLIMKEPMLTLVWKIIPLEEHFSGMTYALCIWSIQHHVCSLLLQEAGGHMWVAQGRCAGCDPMSTGCPPLTFPFATSLDFLALEKQERPQLFRGQHWMNCDNQIHHLSRVAVNL